MHTLKNLVWYFDKVPISFLKAGASSGHSSLESCGTLHPIHQKSYFMVNATHSQFFIHSCLHLSLVASVVHNLNTRFDWCLQIFPSFAGNRTILMSKKKLNLIKISCKLSKTFNDIKEFKFEYKAKFYYLHCWSDLLYDLVVDGWCLHPSSLALVPKMLLHLISLVAETMLSLQIDLFNSFMKTKYYQYWKFKWIIIATQNINQIQSYLGKSITLWPSSSFQTSPFSWTTCLQMQRKYKNLWQIKTIVLFYQ